MKKIRNKSVKLDKAIKEANANFNAANYLKVIDLLLKSNIAVVRNVPSSEGQVFEPRAKYLVYYNIDTQEKFLEAYTSLEHIPIEEIESRGYTYVVNSFKNICKNFNFEFDGIMINLTADSFIILPELIKEYNEKGYVEIIDIH